MQFEDPSTLAALALALGERWRKAIGGVLQQLSSGSMTRPSSCSLFERLKRVFTRPRQGFNLQPFSNSPAITKNQLQELRQALWICRKVNAKRYHLALHLALVQLMFCKIS